MKILLWLFIPLLLIIVFFTLPHFASAPVIEEKSEQPSVSPETVPGSTDASPLDEVTLSLSSPTVLQGEPLLVTIDGPINTSALTGLTLDGTPLTIFHTDDHMAAIVGIDLHKTPGSYPLILTLADGRKIEKTLSVEKRILPVAEFAIPESFGGNTPKGEKELTNNLISDTAILNGITGSFSPEKLWDGAFRYPRDEPIFITDTYGYSRQTGAVNISHNGTDFRAAVATPVYAMNGGKVVFSGSFKNYGKTVIIDHGLGLMTMYMHLSETIAKLNESVDKGDLIAKSGNTGYSLGPHLHLSVRINGFSIDPLKFFELMGEK